MRPKSTQPALSRFRFASGTFVAATLFAILFSVACPTLFLHAASSPAKVVIAHAGLNAPT